MPLLQAVFVGLISLILTPGLLFYFDVTPKAAVLLFAAAILLPFTARSVRPSRAVCIAAIVYALSLVFSSTLSVHPALSWFGSSWRRCGAVSQFAVLLFAWSVIAIGERRTV